MADQIPAPPAQAAATVVPVPVVVPQPTSLQIVSAMIQNLAVIIVLGYAWAIGKLDTTVAVVSLLLVVGIDFANRRRLPTAGASAAVAFGATSVMHALGATGIVGTLLLALTGCGAAMPAADLAPARAAISASESVYALACTDPTIYAKMPALCEDAYKALTAAVTAYNAADKAATDAATKQ